MGVVMLKTVGNRDDLGRPRKLVGAGETPSASDTVFRRCTRRGWAAQPALLPIRNRRDRLQRHLAQPRR